MFETENFYFETISKQNLNMHTRMHTHIELLGDGVKIDSTSSSSLK